MGLLDFLKTKVNNSRVDLSKHYAFQREAVSGTMSKFYAAKDLRTGRLVGLKILDRERTKAFEDRFRGLNKPSEGEMGMMLKHPLLVETLEFGTYHRGHTLRRAGIHRRPRLQFADHRPRQSTGRQPPHFIRQAAEALSVLHAAGFVHRDVAPRNPF